MQRGSLTFWVDAAAVAGWCCQERSGQPGAPDTYSASAIGCALTLQSVYHLSLRTTEGLVVSLMKLLGLSLPVPDYSTLCKRRQRLTVSWPQYQEHTPVHLVVDATGFKAGALWAGRRRVESASAWMEQALHLAQVALRFR